jgi:hypothetical protein
METCTPLALCEGDEDLADRHLRSPRRDGAANAPVGLVQALWPLPSIVRHTGGKGSFDERDVLDDEVPEFARRHPEDHRLVLLTG